MEEVMTYEPREKLDVELERAIGEILSAENEAKSIIGQAEESVKSIQLDGATRERTMRAEYNKMSASARDRALADAEARAQKECERIMAEARAEGEKLVKSKQKDIEKIAQDLFKSVGSKK